jgi:NADH dehydrogenase FAD-containing subunit
VQFWATGSIPNTQVLRGHLSHVLDRLSGRVRVRPTLQLEGYDDIFAIGDVANTKVSQWAGHIAAHISFTRYFPSRMASKLTPRERTQPLQPKM